MIGRKPLKASRGGGDTLRERGKKEEKRVRELTKVGEEKKEMLHPVIRTLLWRGRKEPGTEELNTQGKKTRGVRAGQRRRLKKRSCS